MQREFTVAQPHQAWVTDITYIRTHEGWLYLTVVIDLYSRAVVGWSMKATMATELVLDALMMAVWRRQPKKEIHRCRKRHIVRELYPLILADLKDSASSA